MKTKLEDVRIQLEYPCLMISDDLTLVIFCRDGSGTVIYDESGDCKIGEFRNDFVMRSFKPFYGKVVLQND